MKNKIAIKKDTNIAMLGAIICLVALVILFSNQSVLSFLSKGILFAFGFVGFWILVPTIFVFGLYLILRRKLMKFRFDLTLWGILLIVIAFLILSSSWGSENFEINNFNDTGKNYIVHMFSSASEEGKEVIKLDWGSPSCIDIFLNYIGKSENLRLENTNLGGGVIGYIFCGTLNNAITPVGMIIVSWVLVLIGVLLILNRQIKKLFNYLLSNKQRKAAKEDVYSSYDELDTPYASSEPSIETLDNNTQANKPIENTNNDIYMQDLSMRNFNNTHGLQKPSFILDGKIISNDNNVSPTENNQFIKFDVNTQNNQIENDNKPQIIEENSHSFVEENIKNEDANIAYNESNSNDVIDEQTINNDNEFSFEDVALNNEKHDEPKQENNNFAQVSPKIEEVVQQAQPVNEVKQEIPAPALSKKRPQVEPQPKATVKPLFILPDSNLLDYHENDDDVSKNEESTAAKTAIINQTFVDYNIGAEVVGHTIGPSVTRYDIKLKPNVLVSSINKILTNLAINLSGTSFRFEEIVRGKATSGLELPNDVRTSVGLREAIENMPTGEKYSMNVPFGKDISGNVLSADIRKMPHLLVAGGTGSGKSIFMHSTILSLIMRNTPEQLRILLIDPKKVEMNYYDEIPHLICPNISEAKEALVALRKLVDEMERRYLLFQENRVRDAGEFNTMAKEKGFEPLPTIVVFIDEYADLNEACKEIRDPVVRIAQKARAAGIHLVIATQRPTVNVIDGLIKANLPCRVALKVSQNNDSLVILDESGAEKLQGNGDMIISIPPLDSTTKPRVQGCYVSNTEIDRVCDYLRKQAKPHYYPQFLDLVDHSEDVISDKPIDVDPQFSKEASEEQLLEKIKNDIMSREYCSISFIQRTYGVGFPKAGRLFNKLIALGYVTREGDSRGSKVLIHNESSEEATSSDASTLYIDKDN